MRQNTVSGSSVHQKRLAAYPVAQKDEAATDGSDKFPATYRVGDRCGHPFQTSCAGGTM